MERWGKSVHTRLTTNGRLVLPFLLEQGTSNDMYLLQTSISHMKPKIHRACTHQVSFPLPPQKIKYMPASWLPVRLCLVLGADLGLTMVNSKRQPNQSPHITGQTLPKSFIDWIFLEPCVDWRGVMWGVGYKPHVFETQMNNYCHEICTLQTRRGLCGFAVRDGISRW